MRKILFTFFVLLLIIFKSNGQAFTYMFDPNIIGVSYGDCSWGDYNNDGYLDFVIAGSELPSKIYKNNGNGTFSFQSAIILDSLSAGTVDWVDYDKDGDLDIFMTGMEKTLTVVSKIYKNNGNNTFTEQTGINITGVYYSCSAWGDYDNDGDMDLLVSGYTTTAYITKIYRNFGNNSLIEQSNINLPGQVSGSVAWGDYNNDGLLDILMPGKVYKNNGNNTFTFQSNIVLAALNNANSSWVDYDNDGDLDIFMSGDNLSTLVSKLYKNVGNNSFVEQTPISIYGIKNGSSSWGDYDNDGDLDLLMTGFNGTTGTTSVHINNGNGSFASLSYPFFSSSYGNAVWGDYDNDGDLDIIQCGQGTGNIYRNNINNNNSGPSIPNGLTTEYGSDFIKFLWNKSTDNSTPSSAISYNINIGLTLDSNDIKVSKIGINPSRLLQPELGETKDTFYIFKTMNLQANTKIYFSVQAIDNSFKSSNFSTRDSINISLVIDAGADTIKFVKDTIQLTVTHNAVGSVSYLWSPSIGLDSVNIKSPKAFPTKNTKYFVTVSQGAISKTDSVTININNFKDLNTPNIVNVTYAASKFADYDNDGDLDLIVTGTTTIGATNSPITKLYKNCGNDSFSVVPNTVFPNLYVGSVDWGDYDNDGNLDLFLTGKTSSSTSISKLYKNIGNDSFAEVPILNLPNVFSSSVAWGDYDNDGDLDLLFTGTTNGSISGAYSRIYENLGADSFQVQSSAVLPAIYYGKSKWMDYNNDGFLDIILAGKISSASNGTVCRIYKNNGNKTFSLQSALNMTGVDMATFDLGDVDNDGDLDVLLFGRSTSGYIVKLFNNNLTSFTESTSASFPAFQSGKALFGDYDNDGDLDIIIAGYLSTYLTKVYENVGAGIFIEDYNQLIIGLQSCELLFEDYDIDGDLDLFISGVNSNIVTKIYRNDVADTNQAPMAPTNVQFDFSTKKLVWNRSIDDKTNSNALTYNVQIGTLLNKVIVKSGNSFANSGQRKISAMGNLQLDTFFTINTYNFLYDTTYYYGVQAIDHSYFASTFNYAQFGVPPVGNIPINDTTQVCGTPKQLSVKVLNGDYANLSYSWSPTIGLSNSNIHNPIATPTQTTWYKVIGTSPLLGLTFTDSIKITVIPMTVNAGVDKTLLCGDSSILGPSTNYCNNQNNLSWVWTPVYGLSNSITKNPIVKTAYSTNYKINLASTEGCIAEDSIHLEITPITLNVGNDTTVICGESISFDPKTNYPGFTSNLSWNWSPVYGLDSTNIAHPISKIDSNIHYNLNLTSAEGCYASDSFSILIMPLKVNINDIFKDCGVDTVLSPSSNSLSNSITYNWNPGAGLSNPNSMNPINSSTKNINYVLSVVDGKCFDSDTFNVHINFPTYSQEICQVSVDTFSKKNIICWNKLNYSTLDSFNIYKKDSVLNIFNLIHSQSYSLPSFYIDLNSNPDLSSNQYMISSIDICKNESSNGVIHKTMHLSIGKGTGNNWELSWNKYEGISYDYFYIYRGTTPGNLLCIDSTQNTIDFYIDSPSPGNYYYQIRVRNSSSCSLDSLNASSFSNIVTNKGIGFNTVFTEELKLKIIPNPSKGKFFLSFRDAKSNQFEIRIFSTIGECLFVEKIESNSTNFQKEFNFNSLSKGIYFIHVNSKEGNFVGRIVID